MYCIEIPLFSVSQTFCHLQFNWWQLGGVNDIAKKTEIKTTLLHNVWLAVKPDEGLISDMCNKVVFIAVIPAMQHGPTYH